MSGPWVTVEEAALNNLCEIVRGIVNMHSFNAAQLAHALGQVEGQSRVLPRTEGEPVAGADA